ncbi:MAG: mechanosensitive ion channel family protein [Desulfobacterales bacterium]
MYSKNLKVIVWVGLLIFVLVSAAWSQNLMMLKTGKKHANAESAENPSLPKQLDAENIDHIIAGLSDEQVRRLLIKELKAQALQETTVEPKPEGIAGFIDKIKNLTALLQTRIEFLRSGASAAPQQLAGIYTFLGKGERGTKTVTGVILSVAALLAGALLIEWLFVLYTAAARRRITSTVPSGWGAKIGALSMRALLDFAAIVIFIVAAMTIFFLFLDRTAGQRVLLAAYLAGLVFVQGAYLVLRFFLAPRASTLRILPFSDQTALYLHHWLMALTFVICMGNVTRGVIRLAGATELTVIKSWMVGALIAVGMIIWMILQKRKETAIAFSQGLPESSLRYRLAQKWHHFAVFAVLLLLAAGTGSMILGTASGQGMLTLLMVPLYFLLDWILRLMLEAAFGLVAEPKEQPVPAEETSDGPEDNGEAEAAQPVAGETSKDKAATGRRLDLDRMKGPLRTTLRLALAVLLFFWILNIWDVNLPIGEAVVTTLIKILLVVLICYVAWGIINAAIARRMRREMPEDTSEEMEEGGAGGSRIHTLLMLLRKFMLVVILVMAVLIILSALGVNIGPLIAGAGVFGLAIGFGAQTLVKDIISGVFFLMDDAFRVGDYVECSGTKGSVEHISLRSLRLRNPRGQVYFIPFGDIKLVTNLSRDYVIMKLDFRVRYDADVEKIRKIIKKKVYQPIMDDPELGPKLLEPIKSQGVREMDDSAMIMRVKYKTKPGDQFAIRKEVYRLMQEAFKAEGIEFAHRNVTVFMPPEPGSEASAQAAGEDQQKDAKANSEIQRQAAAGAALAAIQAEEEAEMAKKKPEK